MKRQKRLAGITPDFTSRSPWLESNAVWQNLLPETVPKTAEYPEVPLHMLGRDAARTHPHNLAIYYAEDGRKYTYLEMMHHADRLARGLADLGVKKGDGVGVYMANSPEFIFSVYAISQAGGIIVPINPLLSAEDIAHIIKDCGMIITLICDAMFYPTVEPIVANAGIKHVIVNGDSTGDVISFKPLMDDSKPDPPLVDINPREDPICLMYTGGTTGAPKGVEQTHYSICSNVLQMIAMEPTSPEEEGVVSCVTILPMCHTFGFSQTQLYIAQRAMMILFSSFDPPRVMSAIEMYRTENFVGIPLMFQVIINDPQFLDFDLTSLVRVVSGAAPLPQDLVKRWKEAVGSEVGQGYGLSEACPSLLMRPLWLKPKQDSIGIPLVDTDVKIVEPGDPDSELPAGEVGELVARGPQIMKGYWNLPEKSAEVLRNGWLHTGDLAYMDEEGYVYIAGRLSDMIKYKGYKVLPDEVEDHLHKHPAVLECAVIGVPDREIGETIKAFVVLREEHKGKITEQELIDWSRENMSGYKWPRIVELIDILPRTAIGKIFRKKLRDMEREKT